MRDKIIGILKEIADRNFYEHMVRHVYESNFEEITARIDSLYSGERINDLWNLYSSKELGVMTFGQFKAALEELNNQ